MKHIFVFLMILGLNLGFAQNNTLKLINLKPVIQENVFPEVVYKSNAIIEEKINTFLQIKHLEIVPKKYISNPFEKVTRTDFSSGDVRFYDYKKNITVDNILSLTIEGEATGAYSEGFETYENFDLRNGNLLVLNDIFTKNGLTQINKILTVKINQEIKNYIKKLKTEKPDKKEDADFADEQILLYETCLFENTDVNIDYYRFYFEKNQMVFVKGRCSNHAMRALDDLDSFYVNLSFKSIEKHLTNYGKSLLFNLPIVNTNKPQGKIYKGFINNKYPITAIITEISTDKSVYMKYWYDKVKEPLEWSGTYINNTFMLREEEEHSEDAAAWGTKAEIEAVFTNNKISGTWTNLKTKEILKLELEEF